MDNADVVSVYNRILLSHKKKIMTFTATRMDPEIIILSQKNYLQNSNKLRHRKQSYGYQMEVHAWVGG